MNKKLKLGVIGVFALFVISCSFGSEKEPTQSSGSNTPYLPKTSAVQPPDNGFITEKSWPDSLPKEIPQLSGEIELVMGGSDSIKTRIFYNNLTQQGINQFIADCEQAGFKLTYLVYEVNGNTTASEKKLKAGEYDAIDFKKGDIRMRLETGNGEGTLDITITGNKGNTVDPTQIPWPPELTGVLSQPQGCSISSIANLAFGGFQISCQYADGDIRLESFLSQLSANGYQEKERQLNDQNEVIMLRYQADGWLVEIHPQAFARMMTLMITPAE